MTGVDEFDDLRSRISRQRQRSNALLEIALHESLQDLVRQTLANLEEAEVWLRREDAESTVFVQVAAAAISLSRCRLDFIEDHVRRHGSGTALTAV